MKRCLIAAVSNMGIEVEDLGSHGTSSVDYPDYAAAVALRVSKRMADTGILICGTGIGMDIVANKFPGVRAALLYDDVAARYARMHNNANVAVFGARTMDLEDAVRRMRMFLEEPFEGGRHQARLDKLCDIEKKNQKVCRDENAKRGAACHF
jgi:ribose 5-phosphate isomerase B